MLTISEIREYAAKHKSFIEIENWLFFSEALFYARENEERMEDYICLALEQLRREGKNLSLCESPYRKDRQNGIIAEKEDGCVYLCFDFER